MMRIVLVAALFMVLHGLLAWLINQAQDAGPDIVQGKLASLSYAPFRHGQSPLQEIFPEPAQIEQDLLLLSQKTTAIRTYASDVRMGPIAELAGKYGLQVTQGAWLGYSDKDNRREIAALIKVANRYPDVIKRVIVGNEVLLRGEMTAQKLIDYIRQVKKAVRQPVSYADVWSMYMKYPQLIAEVDFITIHILPYWEDEPIAVEAAPAHIVRAFNVVRQEAATLGHNKAVYIGESGWPSDGRQRGHAVPGRINASRFIRGLIDVANQHGFDYNIVEAFDQHWKSKLEGTVGANWGLFSEDRRQFIPLAGTVSEQPYWYARWQLAALIVIIVIVIFRRGLGTLGLQSLLLYLGLLQLITASMVISVDVLWRSSYDPGAQMQALLLIMLIIILMTLLLHRAYRILSDGTTTDSVGVALHVLYLLVAVFAMYKTYGLAEWGRYRDFPYITTYVPVAGVLGLFSIVCFSDRRVNIYSMDVRRLFGTAAFSVPLYRIIGVALCAMGIAMLYGETRAFMLGRDMVSAYPDFYTRLKLSLEFVLCNGQLLQWLFALLVLALPFLFSRRAANAPHYQ